MTIGNSRNLENQPPLKYLWSSINRIISCRRCLFNHYFIDYNEVYYDDNEVYT